MTAQLQPDHINLWIAEDPTQPGSAFAWHSAADNYRQHVAEWSAEIEQVYGVKPRLVNFADAKQMMKAWAPEKSALVAKH